MRAVALLSGGLDSCVAGTIAKRKYSRIHALTFLYGQSHAREVESAKRIAKYLKTEEHIIISLDSSLFSKSSLVGGVRKISKRKIPKRKIPKRDIPKRDIEKIKEEIPSTYVPARNIIFLSYALAYAENIEADAIFIGVNAIDYSGYPDCRPEFIRAFQRVSDVGTKRGVEGKSVQIEAPLINMTKAEIIKKGIEVKAPIHLTWSCYSGREKACGRCDSCLFRLKGFQEAGYKDPIEYEEFPDWYKEDRLLPLP